MVTFIGPIITQRGAGVQGHAFPATLRKGIGVQRTLGLRSPVIIGALTALAASIRPPVATLPFSEGIASTEFSKRARNSSMEMAGLVDKTSAATPATNGVAIEVP